MESWIIEMAVKLTVAAMPKLRKGEVLTFLRNAIAELRKVEKKH